MFELFQTEWCPSSHRVRQRLTELGLAYVVRQVPVDRADRVELVERCGVDTIPVVICDTGEIVAGETEILAHLDERFAEPVGAEFHRLKAERFRQRLLEEVTT